MRLIKRSSIAVFITLSLVLPAFVFLSLWHNGLLLAPEEEAVCRHIIALVRQQYPDNTHCTLADCLIEQAERRQNEEFMGQWAKKARCALTAQDLITLQTTCEMIPHFCE